MARSGSSRRIFDIPEATVVRASRPTWASGSWNGRQKYLDEGSHRRLYTFSPNDYKEMSGIWGNGEVALPLDPRGELEVVDGMPEGGKIHQLVGVPSAFTPDYAPEEMFEIAGKLYKASR